MLLLLLFKLLLFKIKLINPGILPFENSQIADFSQHHFPPWTDPGLPCRGNTGKPPYLFGMNPCMSELIQASIIERSDEWMRERAEKRLVKHTDLMNE